MGANDFGPQIILYIGRKRRGKEEQFDRKKEKRHMEQQMGCLDHTDIGGNLMVAVGKNTR